ncbi:MAG TPA: hypothetical protein VFE46_01370 [Pirellulales bacterium]|jgi:hypothetical protein|nr:hypothetical protein [Pirellulales bacterium]
MHLDIRFPIGLLFAVLGAMLVAFGILTQFDILEKHVIYDNSLGYNVNLWCGLVMLAFGIFMFLMARRGTSAVRSTQDSPEGRELEATEQRREMQGGHGPQGH